MPGRVYMHVRAWYPYCMPECMIYGLIDPRTIEVRYVGKTAVTVPKRIIGHYRRARVVPSPVGNWLLKLERLGLKPLWTVLEEQPSVWQDAERKWIAHYRALYPGRMLNLADGGEGGNTGYRFQAAIAYWNERPEELKAKMEKARKARGPWTEERRAALSARLIANRLP